MELDRYHVGYDPEEIIYISKKNALQDLFDLEGFNLIAYNNADLHQRVDGNALYSEQRNSQEDNYYQITVAEISSHALITAMDELPSVDVMKNQREKGRVEIVKNNSFDSDVPSVMSARSTIITSPNILRLTP